MKARKALIKCIESLSHSRTRWDAWRDLMAACAISISNAVDRGPDWQKREDQYLRIVAKWGAEEVRKRWPQMFALIVDALEESPWDDVLGAVYSELEISSKELGQFFTPIELCRMTAMVTIDADVVNRQRPITICDPAVGGGAQLIAAAGRISQLGLNPARDMHVTGVDIDITAVHMAYIQLSLYGVPGVVVHGNSLSLDEYSLWRTPLHIAGLWESPRLIEQAIEKSRELIASLPDPASPPNHPTSTRRRRKDAAQLQLDFLSP